MTAHQLRWLVAAIRKILETHGQESKAAWLGERERILGAGGPAGEITKTIEELHSVVVGMGGLLDLPLTSNSQEPAQTAQARLDELADQLFEATRPGQLDAVDG